MACSGLHCAGCAGGVTAPPVAVVALLGLPWLIEHAVEVAVTSAVCGVLAVAAVVALMRWCDRREARHAASRTIWTAREVSAACPADLPPAGHAALGRDARRELNAPAVHLHFHGLPDAEQAAVIRHALGRTDQ